MARYVDNSDVVRRGFKAQMTDAMNEVRDEALDSVLWMMMHGYSTPHGKDGHTEIYDTGALYQSIEAKTDAVWGSGLGMTVGNNTGLKVTVSGNTEYASYVHQGTSKLEGRPFITDGIKRIQPTLRKIVEKHMH